jgi:hypothetical protein
MRARLLLLLAVVACRDHNTPGYVDVPGIPLLEIKAPPDTKVAVRRAAGEDAEDLDALKAKLGDRVSWLSTETTPDGFVATYSMAQSFAVQVRRTIRGRIYMCGGANLPTKESLDPIIKACASLKAK